MRKLIVNGYLTFLLAASVLVALPVIAQGELKESPLSPIPANPYRNPYEAISYPERLEVFRDGKKIGVVRSEKPNIVQWGFTDSGNHIVVRSQGDAGLAIIELFETATCTQVDKLMLSGDQKQLPAWTAGFIH